MNNKNNKVSGGVDSLATDNARLRARIQDLETYLAGRKSRWETLVVELQAERDSAAELKTAVGVRDARISGFARTAAELEQRIEDQDRAIERLRDRLSRDGHVRRSALTDVSPTQSARSGEKFKVILRAAYDKLAAMRIEQTRLKGKIEEKDAYIDRLCGKLSQLEVERNKSVGTLRKQRKIIEHIETEIRERLSQVALSSRKPTQRRAISAAIHKLDERREKLRAKIDSEAISTMGRLTLLDDADQPVEFEIGGKTLTIGRGDHNDIRIRRQSVSREHARLTAQGEGVTIEDLCSRNGTRVNNQPIARHRLRTGDLVAVGKVRFRFTASVIPFNRPNAS